MSRKLRWPQAPDQMAASPPSSPDIKKTKIISLCEHLAKTRYYVVITKNLLNTSETTRVGSAAEMSNTNSRILGLICLNKFSNIMFNMRNVKNDHENTSFWIDILFQAHSCKSFTSDVVGRPLSFLLSDKKLLSIVKCNKNAKKTLDF